jgi:hypothetical protein
MDIPVVESNIPQNSIANDNNSASLVQEKHPRNIIFIYLLIILFFVIIGVFYVVLTRLNKTVITQTTTQTSNSSSNSLSSFQGLNTQVTTGKFVHYQYLSQPTFYKTASSNLAQTSEYSIKGNLPSAKELIAKPSLNMIPWVYAQEQPILPVYLAKRHEMTSDDAKAVAVKFNITGEAKREGYDPPGYYAFIWDTPSEYFSVSGGSGSGGFEYFLKGTGLTGTASSDDETKASATEFLRQKGLADDTYFVSGVLNNVGDISKRSGFREDHKQVYFRKKINNFQVYDWVAGGGSPITDKYEVWVGVGGRILYVSNESYWTTVDLTNKTNYLLREPISVFEDIKNGKGKLAWMDYDSIGVYTGIGGPTAPDSSFAVNGKLKNVIVENVELAYYHDSKGVDEYEFYQPIYVFTGHATLDWKDGYTPAEAEKILQNKRTSVAFVASTVSPGYFFENPVNIATSEAVPVYNPPEIIPGGKTGAFLLKISNIQQLDDPKRNITLSWDAVPGTVKYNVYLRLIGETDYSQTALLGTGDVSQVIGVNKYLDYYFKVRACKTADDCVESNEVFLPQEQKPAFTLTLGEINSTTSSSQISLHWTEVPTTVKYNIYLRHNLLENYTTALAGIGGLQYSASVDRQQDNYFIIQACKSASSCYSSNEVFLKRL